VGWTLGEVERWEKWKSGWSEIGGGWSVDGELRVRKNLPYFVEVKRSLVLPNEEIFFLLTSPFHVNVTFPFLPKWCMHGVVCGFNTT
jgi:hypothetical protein